MAITRDAIKRRMARLAVRMNRCPIHGTKLVCLHEYLEAHEWTGTPAELKEACNLWDVMEPYLPPVPPSGQVCPTCPEHEPLWCDTCYKNQAVQHGPIHIPDEVMTQQQYDRYRELAKLRQPRPPGATGPSNVVSILKQALREQSTPPPEPPAPIAQSVPTPVVSIAMPVPAPVVDADDDIDTELAAIVEQLKRRLTP